MNTPFNVSWTTKKNNKFSQSLDQPAMWLAREARNGKAKEFCVDQNQTIHFDGDQRGLTIRLLDGRVWITQQNDSEDYVLMPGAEFTVTNPGLVVVEGVFESLVRVTPA